MRSIDMELEQIVAGGNTRVAACMAGTGMAEPAFTVPDSDGYPHEYASSVPVIDGDATEPVILIGLSKAGGGTIGKAYSGSWAYTVLCDGIPVIVAADLGGSPARGTHEEMTRILADFLAVAGESLAHRGDESDYSREYDAAARDSLAAAYERLSAFAGGLS